MERTFTKDSTHTHTYLRASLCYLRRRLQGELQLAEQPAEDGAPASHSVLVGGVGVLRRGRAPRRGQRGQEAQRERAQPQPHGLLLQGAPPVLLGQLPAEGRRFKM